MANEKGNKPAEIVPVAPVAPEVVAPPAPTPIQLDPMARQPNESLEAYAARLTEVARAVAAQVNQAKVTSGEYGKNVIGKIDGNILTITIDLSTNLGKSKAGKSTMVATTSGAFDLGNGRGRINLNLFR